MLKVKSAFAAMLAGVFILGAVSVSQAVSLIDTTGSWDGSSFVLSFGEVNTSTYGQTFTATGSETVLDNFTFFIDDHVDPDLVDFEAFVFAWDGSKATGSALFASDAMSSSNNGGNDGFESFTINTGGISLVSGEQYVAFFSAANHFDGETGTGRWGFLGGADVYSGGRFVFMNNGDNFDALLADGWSQNWISAGSDLAFSMNFSEGAPVPEPSTFLLMAAGLLGLVGVGRGWSQKN